MKFLEGMPTRRGNRARKQTSLCLVAAPRQKCAQMSAGSAWAPEWLSFPHPAAERRRLYAFQAAICAPSPSIANTKQGKEQSDTAPRAGGGVKLVRLDAGLPTLPKRVSSHSAASACSLSLMSPDVMPPF